MQYVGEVDECGLPHGLGCVKFTNGDSYEGSFKCGKFDGSGVYTCSSGCKYDGSWKEGVPHGLGKATYVAFDRGVGRVGSGEESYEGCWLEGKFCGKGTYRFAGGWAYDGEWNDGVPNGRGTFTCATSGATKLNRISYEYDGSWSSGYPKGRGVLKVLEGDQRRVCYDGEWLKGRPEGRGEALFKNKSTYEGNFHDGKPHGKGIRKPFDAHTALSYGVEYENGVMIASDLCIECVQRKRNSICVPCGHVFYCYDCAQMAYGKNNLNGVIWCKLCSERVERFVEVKDAF